MPERAKPCSIRSLASHLGLSTCIVSKILNGRLDASASEETRARVFAAAKKLNYVPNINAKRLFQRKSGVLGVLIPTQDEMGVSAFSDMHFSEILCGIEAKLKDTPYNLMVLFNREDYKRSGRYGDLFRSGLIDGLLIWGVHKSDDYWRRLKALAEPRIFLTSIPDLAPGERVDSIVADYEDAAFQVTKRLLDSGASRFLWLAGKEDTSILGMLEEGMRRAFAGGPVGMDSVVKVHSSYGGADGDRISSEFFQRGACDAVLATSPRLARGAQDAAERLGLRVGIGSFDGHLRRPREPGDRFLTALMSDVMIGEMAVASLLSLIDGRAASGSTQLKAPVSIADAL